MVPVVVQELAWPGYRNRVCSLPQAESPPVPSEDWLMPAGFILDVIVHQSGQCLSRPRERVAWPCGYAVGLRLGESSVPLLPVALIRHPSLGDLLNSAVQEE